MIIRSPRFPGWEQARSSSCAGHPPLQHRSPFRLWHHPAPPRSVWGNQLRNALLRSRPAHISLAANPTQTARRMTKPSNEPHPHQPPGRR